LTQGAVPSTKASTTPPAPLPDSLRLDGEAPQGGYLLGGMEYNKPALSVDDHVELYRRRGLVIPDVARVIHYIKYIGYYRLSGYACAFRDPDADEERFLDGTTFDSILDAYIFDRKIRHLLMDALERIEISVRSSISDIMAEAHGPFWLLDDRNFQSGQHQSVIELIKKAIGPNPRENQHDHVRHYYETYSSPDIPPCWMVVEIMSFGEISKVYRKMVGSERRPIADAFSVQHDVFESWLHSLSTARNICAHHGRFWNRKLKISPKIPKNLRLIVSTDKKATLYSVCVIAQYLMSVIADGSRWSERLAELVNSQVDVDIERIGFSPGWDDDSFWHGMNT
jgi:abortive infection bacteriophage resistance protein